MPGTCGICGDQCVERQTATGYAGACAECRATYETPPSHVETCEKDECLVCDDYHREFSEDE